MRELQPLLENHGLLLLFLIPAALIGLVLRKPLAKFMTWYVEQVESSKLVG